MKKLKPEAELFKNGPRSRGTNPAGEEYAVGKICETVKGLKEQWMEEERQNRERTCADIIDTVLIPSVGRFQFKNLNIFFKKYTETILS